MTNETAVRQAAPGQHRKDPVEQVFRISSGLSMLLKILTLAVVVLFLLFWPRGGVLRQAPPADGPSVPATRGSLMWMPAGNPELSASGLLTSWPSAASTIVMVQPDVRGREVRLLRMAAAFDDRFTASRMVVGRCVSGRRCIVVRDDSRLPVGAARTEGSWTYAGGKSRPGNATTRIHVEGRFSDAQVRDLFEHELGHAFGLSHVKACNIMMPVIGCGWRHSLPAQRFTAAQRAILAKY